MDERLNQLFHENGHKGDLTHSCIPYQNNISWKLTTGVRHPLLSITDLTDAIYQYEYDFLQRSNVSDI
jgi:hypothetical protein